MLVVLASWGASDGSSSGEPTAIDVRTTQTGLQLDGRDVFLFGVSTFDALSSASLRDADLDALQQWNVRALRVWAHWREPIYGPAGALTSDGRRRLEALAKRLQHRQFVLELVLLRP